MKNAEAILSVKFTSSHSFEKLMKVCKEDLDLFRDVPGLTQKFYLLEDSSESISGIYIFETKEAREAFWDSKLAQSIPTRYGVVTSTLRVERYDMGIVLNDIVLA